MLIKNYLNMFLIMNIENDRGLFYISINLNRIYFNRYLNYNLLFYNYCNETKIKIYINQLRNMEIIKIKIYKACTL